MGHKSFDCLNAWVSKAVAAVVGTFGTSDGNPRPTYVADTGLAAGRSLMLAPGEQRAGPLRPGSAVVKVGAAADLLAEEDAASPRDYLERRAAHTARADYAPRSVSALTAPIETCGCTDEPYPE